MHESNSWTVIIDKGCGHVKELLQQTPTLSRKLQCWGCDGAGLQPQSSPESLRRSWEWWPLYWHHWDCPLREELREERTCGEDKPR